MISSNPTSTHPGHHRRQLSQPFEAAPAPRAMPGAPSYRSHRRGQTVDYAALGPQLTSASRVSRRTAPKTVPELRDFFNEKSGFPRQSGATQQQPTAHLRQVDQSFFPSGLPLNSTYNPMPYMLREEELQGMFEAATADASSNTYAPGLSRSASDNAGRTPSLQNALHRIQQECSFPMAKGEQPVLYSWPEHQPIVQPKAISPKMSTFYTSPLTPDATPMKASFDFPMYHNDQTPTKSQSFSIPRTPVSAAMQRAQSLQGAPVSSPLQAKNQMLSPADSSSVASFTELAAMPSPASRGVSPQNIDGTTTPSTGNQHLREVSPRSSLDESIPEHPEELNDYDLDARVKASVRETGVSNDQIAKYISGPNADGKWQCLFPNCNCDFGRKENIKSHVQTHLDDRPYKCDVCEKEFVRGHDLKRHLKTHTGKKPYICACGAKFARHDALTRHRQRDMCVGGMTGNIPKTTRRGRPPKKNRPDMETRQAKSTRTRQRAANRGPSSSPDEPEVASFQDGPIFTSPNYAPSNTASAYTPPTSPGDSANNGNHTVSSPTPIGNQVSSQFEDDMLPPPLSPPQIAHVRYEQAMAQFNRNMIVEPAREYMYSDSALSPHEMSSPHTAPTLAESSVGSEIDLFMTQDPSEQVKEEFGTLTTQSLTDFSNSYYVDASDFPTSSFYQDLPEKPFSGLDTMDDPYADSIDTLSNEFLVDP
ncbi:hypothetical protein N7532_004621 [Penicillium argentinense]|uniref:Wilms tumor protein homolog n=1 Tax=Penicillium argentinense TaxID=1131581 RepID=A0A9W9FQ81_9EURO|nr:uncharacterized protein N7532_004621 [Penicillium argentinense]KAJ5104092.1 hypothetical protein N7532_004621 [Penicillium argentinense]